MNHRHYSPLRYPGGKAVLGPVLADVLAANDLHDGKIVEPFAGGAGASLYLLFGEYAGSLVLNDADPRVAAFWRSVLHQTDELCDRILTSRPTMKLWRACRDVYRSTRRRSQIDMAFAVFFLNRCNRSGVLINGGPIGGHKQMGAWGIDARYNRPDLVRRIRRIAGYGDGITVTTMDARELLRSEAVGGRRTFVFLDPPYYEKGQRLYMNNLAHKGHEELATLLLEEPSFNWVLTYDDVPQVRALYASLSLRMFRLGYSAYERRLGRELIIFDPRLSLPDDAFRVRTKPGRIRFGVTLKRAAAS
jgi:DNA adenine methylase